MKYQYIDSAEKLFRYSDSLKERNIETVAIDIEGESNLHQYGEKLCLIQVYDGTEAAIIDPFVTPRKQIQDLLENRNILKIMYDAPGDRAFLFKNSGIDTASILDLQVAVTLLGYEKKGLNSVLKQALGIDTERSKKRFQRYNWNTRPLHPEAIEYALEDVVFLFQLKDNLMAEIQKAGLLEAFILRNLQVQNKPHIYHEKPGLLRSRKFRDLKKSDQRIFEKLFLIRENHAEQLNFPPNSVLPNDVLFLLVSGKTALSKTSFGNRVPGAVRARIIEEMGKVLR